MQTQTYHITDYKTHCHTLPHTATHCHTLQHTATHCNTLQHTATTDIPTQTYYSTGYTTIVSVYTHTHSLSLCFVLRARHTHSHTLSLFCSFSLSLTHTHTLVHHRPPDSSSATHTHTLSLSHPPLPLPPFFSLPPTLTHLYLSHFLHLPPFLCPSLTHTLSFITGHQTAAGGGERRVGGRDTNWYVCVCIRV